MRWTIRAKLSVLVLAVLLPLLAGVALKFSVDLAEERTRAQAEMREAAQAAARHLDEVLAGQLENLGVLASIQSFEWLDDQDLAVFAARVRAGHPFVRRYLTVTPAGAVGAASARPPSDPTAQSLPPSLPEAALRERAPQVGSLRPAASGGGPVIPLVVPAFNSRGDALGAAVAEIDLAALSTFLGGAWMPIASSARFVVGDGVVLARVGGPARPLGEKFAPAPEALALLRQRADVAEWSGEDGVPYLAAAAPMRRAPWTVVAAVPGGAARSTAVRRAQWNILGLTAATLAAVLGAWLISRRTTRSIQTLIEGVRGLTAGGRSPVSLPASHELAELAQQFNRAMEERGAAEAAAEARQRRLRALAEVNLSLSQQLDLGPLLRQITHALAYLTGAHNVVMWEVDPASGMLVRRAWTADPSLGTMELPPSLSVEQGGTGWIARHRQPLFIEDVSADPRIIAAEWAVSRELTAFAGVPVAAGDDLVGVLTLNLKRGRLPQGDDRALLSSFASQAAVAVRNAQLFAEAEERRRQAQTLSDLGRTLAQALDPGVVAQGVVDSVRQLLSARNSALFRLEPRTGDLVSVAISGDIGRLGGFSVVFPAGLGAAGLAVQQRRPVTTPNVLTDPRVTLTPELRARLETAPYRSVLTVPLTARDVVIGALSLGDAEGRLFGEGEVRLAQAFADQAALALDNARMYAELQARLQELQDTQAQLVEVGKLSAVGQLVSGVAHELNNPLSVVIGYGQLLLSKDPPPEVRRPLELIVSQGERMAKIIQGLLLFSRQRKPERRALSLREVIEQIVGLRATQLALSGIQLETAFEADVPLVEGDSHQLQQVVLNLFLNAEQAILGSGVGGPRIGDHIRVSTATRCAADGTWVIAQVTDNGPGIPPEVLPRIFEPFFTTKTVGEGTGLGLSVSYGILQQHGGRLSAESEPGRTVFTLELPAASVGNPPGDTRRAHGAAGHGRRVLVVDDEPDIVELVRSVLVQHGWRVDVAPGGRAGLERLRQARYDLVLSDIRMPDGDGAEFYRAAVAQRGELAERFLFITGATANPEAWRFLQATRAPVLEKPFTPEALLRAVEQVSDLTSGKALA